MMINNRYNYWLFSFLFTLFACAKVSAESPASNWKGFYFGATTGGVLSRFNTKTSTEAGTLLDPAQANAVNNVGNQNIDTKGFLSGIEGGYNWQFNHLLIGLSADLQALSTNGDTNSGAVPYPDDPHNQLVITSYGNNNWLLTARPRLGWITNHWLVYLTGGMGLTFLQSDFVFSTHLGDFESKRISTVEAGYVIGAGIETGISNHISLKAEYLFANFNDEHASLMNHHLPPGQVFSNSVNLKSTLLKLGVNYHFDQQFLQGSNMSELLMMDQWQSEVGGRLFFSTGIDGAPQPLLGNNNMSLISRLTFSDLSAVSEEIFARADHLSGFFAKGNVGAGSVTNGQLNDEDFPAGGAYSNTLSDVWGNLSYATIDLGYSLFKTASAKTGAFIGYNYYAQNLNAYGCDQLAGAEVCVPSGELNNFLGISEEDRFNSLRIGLASQVNLTSRLKLTSEAAYLPYVYFRGTDLHNARQLLGPEQSIYGDGAMLEAILDYQLTDAWNIGLGGRYWMWNTHTGTVTFDFLGSNETFDQPARYHAERYGAFLQLNYRDRPSHDSMIWTAPLNWRGAYIGGQLGGAWGRNNWSDPFGATMTSDDFINVPGFGDKIRLTGPLGGVNVNVNWQTERLIYGVGGSASIADIRGEDTLFSGIGGVNGQAITNCLVRFVGRVGATWDRSLFYINAGPALLATQYTINGNTNVLKLGSDSQTTYTWGWTAGMGVEYALNDYWTSSVEYDYISVPHRDMSFPSVNIINSQTLSANQTLNVFAVGINYRFFN